MATDVINTDAFAHIVDAISTNLGIAAKQIFDVFVGAQPIIGMLNLASLLLVILMTYYGWKASRKVIIALAMGNDGNLANADEQFVALLAQIVVVSVVLLVSWIVVTSIVAPSILKIICPEYTAMKEIIGLVSP